MVKLDMSLEDLELMNYDDIAYLILEKQNSKMKISDLFKNVCELLELDESEYESHIADFFELLSTDKRFIMLENGYWDLKIKHNKGMVIEDDDDEEEIVLEDDEQTDEDIFQDEDTKESDDDIEEDDLSGLVIIDDSDEENL